MNILYVGFKGMHNSSCQLVNSMQGNQYLLTNSFQGLKKDIDAIRTTYDMVLMFGLDQTLTESVRIEKCAQKDGHFVFTTADLSELSRKMEQYGIMFSISEQPTNYLCNEAYYEMLVKMECPVVLIHIPSLKYFTEDLKNRLMQALEF